jgi:GNAT superfamily N-acetyltransferase
VDARSWHRDDGFEISTDPARVDVELTHRFLSEQAYWSAGIPRDILERAIAGSMVFGIYRGPEQVGFARVVSDRATFAWIGDVFVLPEHRGHGLSKWLMECITTHPELQGLRRWMLATRDAHGLYSQYGFAPLHDPTRFMERWDPDVYKRQRADEGELAG